MTTAYFFVYGTLKVDNYFSAEFDKYRLSCCGASLEGYNLLDLGPFPGIVKGKGIVHGEVHKYTNIDFVKNRLDQIEGYNENAPTNSLFLQKKEIVTLDTGEKVEAYIYVFNARMPIQANIIESGVWERQ